MENNQEKHAQGLTKYLSPLGVWALSFGCSVGWGAFIMPGSTFMPVAGPIGTAIGLAIGSAIMLIIGMNYRYLMHCYPDAGGTFIYTCKEFCYDHGFLSAWFLILTYVAIAWANMTALALIFRNCGVTLFEVGLHYNIAGYEIYFGEIIFEITVFWLCALVCAKRKFLAENMQIILALLLMLGIIVIYIVVSNASSAMGGASIEPLFVPEKGIFSQIINIIVLVPWAFIGFESVSHSVEGFNFEEKKTTGIMIFTVITIFLAYVLLVFVAVFIHPEGYSNWFEYFKDLGNKVGLSSIPIFYGVHKSAGNIGIAFLGFVLGAAILTGIIGNMIAASRLMVSMSRENMLPKRFSELTETGLPQNAIQFIFLISCVIPFFGRTATGWIVDVTTVGATIAYGFTSAAAYKRAKREGIGFYEMTGGLGIVASLFFGMFLVVPNLWLLSAMAAESYLILAIWSILGFIFFRWVFSIDEEQKLGKSTIMWIAMVFVIFFSSLMWTRQTTHSHVESLLTDITQYYSQEMSELGIPIEERNIKEEDAVLAMDVDKVSDILLSNSIIQMTLILGAIAIFFNVYAHLQKREKKIVSEKIKAEENSKAKTTFLSNMSHDIRTPMNAIMGYVNLSKKEDITLPEMKECMNKIEDSSKHLLELINDILEMSRIENGRIELAKEDADIVHLTNSVKDLFVTQMQEKKITFIVDCIDIKDRVVMLDKSHYNRMLLNLISNAYKFTPEGGEVNVSVKQKGVAHNGQADYEIRVSDSGIGMSREFAEKVFEAFERERTSTVSGIQGTGLGMAITKNIVDLMGGRINVITAPGEGTIFVINVSLPLGDLHKAYKEAEGGSSGESVIDFRTKRVLLTEDIEVNREIAARLLKRQGFMVDTAENGQEAVDKVKESMPGYYDLVLMDIQMPVMNGYDATKAIRQLDEERGRKTPIIAMTANAFSEDVQHAHDAGMDAHIAKPIDPRTMMDTITEVLLWEEE